MGKRIESTGEGCIRERSPATLGAGLVGVVFFSIGIGTWINEAVAAGADGRKPDQKALAQGRELFEREWLPGDSRSHGGDGLGPVYNDSSCVACHNQGGSGGGGAASKNVDIITASPGGGVMFRSPVPPGGLGVEQGFLAKALGSLVGLDAPQSSRPAQTGAAQPARQANTPSRVPARRKIDTGPLVKTHPGFRTSRSVVLHRFGTEGGYESWRQSTLGFHAGLPPQMDRQVKDQFLAQNSINFEQNQILNRIGEFDIVRSQRNPTALFGAGLLDSIPEQVIEEAAKVKHAGFPAVSGRISRLKDKRIGRFGWKAQTASLQDFVLTACAVELGLEVPGRHQGGSPQKPEAQAKGLDLALEECNSLAAYIRELPRPSERTPATANEAHEIAAGRALFATIGCATCHTPKLGDVVGIYSDLLLHDLGQQLGDTGQYGVFDPSSSEDEIVDEVGPIADAAGGLPPPIRVRSSAESVAVSVTLDARARVVAVSAPAPPAPLGAAVAPAPPPEAPQVPAPAAPPASEMVVQQSAGGMIRISSMMQGNVTAVKRPTTGPASRFEWRTPPLWGFRDSGPYLHDGRAETLDQTVALHGGEAAMIAPKYFRLSGKERRQVEAFLKSLTAPPPSELLAHAGR
ncbi:MAG: di-heme oxidoredictase family protein [Isosphaerales bacterium]